jgi:hypothetical protein
MLEARVLFSPKAHEIAFDLGYKAHKSGKENHPIGDKAVVDLVRRHPLIAGGTANFGHGGPLFKSWSKGWDKSSSEE